MRSRFAAVCSPILDMRAQLRDGTMTALSVLAMLTLLGGLASPAMAQEKLWMTQFGTTSRDNGYDLAPDGVGGVIIAGATQGSLGGANAGDYDAYIARYDAAGTQLWLRQFGTEFEEHAAALAPDHWGGAFVASWTSGSLGGPNAGSSDAYVARYNKHGIQRWIRQFGTANTDSVSALAPDGAGGVMVAGTTWGSLGGPNAGMSDVFVARYDVQGTQLWIRQFGTSEEDHGYALASDGKGGVMVAGKMNEQWGGGSHGEADAFIARYDASGNQLWIRQFGIKSYDVVHDLAPDGSGGVMVKGYTSEGSWSPDGNSYVAQFDASGIQIWIHQFPMDQGVSAVALAPDGSGDFVVTGYTEGSLGGANAGGTDAYIAQYDVSGNLRWIRQFGTSGFDGAGTMAPDGAGGMMVTGVTAGSLGGAHAGNFDVFIARFVPCYADLDTGTGAGTLDIFDFLAFQDAFILGERAACDCDTSTGWLVCDVFDFLCFQNAFTTGCS